MRAALAAEAKASRNAEAEARHRLAEQAKEMENAFSQAENELRRLLRVSEGQREKAETKIQLARVEILTWKQKSKEVTKKHEEARTLIKELTNMVREQQSKLSSISGKHQMELRKERNLAKDSVAKFTREMREEMNNQKEKESNLHSELKKTRERVAELMVAVESAKKEAEGKLAMVSSELSRKKTELGGLTKRSDDLQTALNVKTKMLEAHNAEIKELKDRMKRLNEDSERRKKRWRRKEEALSESLAEAEDAREAAERQLEESQAINEDLEAIIETMDDGDQRETETMGEGREGRRKRKGGRIKDEENEEEMGEYYGDGLESECRERGRESYEENYQRENRKNMGESEREREKEREMNGTSKESRGTNDDSKKSDERRGVHVKDDEDNSLTFDFDEIIERDGEREESEESHVRGAREKKDGRMYRERDTRRRRGWSEEEGVVEHKRQTIERLRRKLEESKQARTQVIFSFFSFSLSLFLF